MKFCSLLLPCLLCLPLLPVAAAQARPPITGISHIAVYDDAAQARHFYVESLGCVAGADPENPAGARYYINAEQFVEVLPLPANPGPSRLDHLAYSTPNAEGLRRFLGAHGVTVPASVQRESDGIRWFQVKDPEGNVVQFTQGATTLAKLGGKPAFAKLPGNHIIHVGMLVRERAAEDKFYRDLLNFQPYWFGGMQPDKIDWVSQQVPNGHDWLEYMLTSGPSGGGIPAAISQQQLGVLNHFSVGVVKMTDAYATVKPRLDPAFRNDGHTQMGKDGKWQFNMYDPDGTRVELMEYSAVEKPCCSPFTAPDPKPAE
jgi:catechol 2,3-dioxygenase-like lactoylglutathione lyase family enzyme